VQSLNFLCAHASVSEFVVCDFTQSPNGNVLWYPAFAGDVLGQNVPITMSAFSLGAAGTGSIHYNGNYASNMRGGFLSQYALNIYSGSKHVEVVKHVVFGLKAKSNIVFGATIGTELRDWGDWTTYAYSVCAGALFNTTTKMARMFYPSGVHGSYTIYVCAVANYDHDFSDNFTSLYDWTGSNLSVDGYFNVYDFRLNFSKGDDGVWLCRPALFINGHLATSFGNMYLSPDWSLGDYGVNAFWGAANYAQDATCNLDMTGLWMR